MIIFIIVTCFTSQEAKILRGFVKIQMICTYRKIKTHWKLKSLWKSLRYFFRRFFWFQFDLSLIFLLPMISLVNWELSTKHDRQDSFTKFKPNQLCGICLEGDSMRKSGTGRGLARVWTLLITRFCVTCPGSNGFATARSKPCWQWGESSCRPPPRGPCPPPGWRGWPPSPLPPLPSTPRPHFWCSP